MLVFLVCGGTDFLKYRLVGLEMMASALVPEAVLLTTAGASVVSFTEPSAAETFDHKSKGEKKDTE